MSSSTRSSSFQDHFASMADPRIDRSKKHQLLDILFICVAGTIAGCDGPSDIAQFAREKLSWCRRFVPLKNGVPSHDTVGRVLALIKPDQFQAAFLQWVSSFVDGSADEQEPRFVPIDGKTLRGSGGAKGREHPLHLVSAWATKQGMTLGQVAVDSKSNEITAIPKLLEMLELTGAIVSIDAMGCQKEIAKEIVNGGGDYVLAVKDNQPALAKATEEFFSQRHENRDFEEHACRQYRTVDRSRGRTVERHFILAPVPDTMRHFRGLWKGLAAVGQVITITTIGERQTSEVRYYICSRKASVKEFARSVRSHWSIESMHWILDVVFSEDSSRIRNGDGTENFAMLRKFVVGILKRDTSQGSLKGKRKRAGWNTAFLEKLLFGTSI